MADRKEDRTRMTRAIVFICACWTVSPALAGSSAGASAGNRSAACGPGEIESAARLVREGRGDAGIAAVTGILAGCGPDTPAAGLAQLHLILSDAHIASGRYAEAAADLAYVLEQLPLEDAPALRGRLLSSLGAAQMSLGDMAAADVNLGEGLKLAVEAGDTGLQAVIHNNAGNLSAQQGRLAEALDQYETSADLAQEAGNSPLAIRSRLNAVDSLMKLARHAQANALLSHSLVLARQLPDSREKAFLLAGTGRRLQRLAESDATLADAALRGAHDALSESTRVAALTDDLPAQSYALGYLGGLYERNARPAEALDLARRALFAAQQGGHRELEFRWQWLIARCQLALGNVDQGVAQYRLAIQTLQSINPELRRAVAFSGDDSGDGASGIYLEFADLLLRRHADQGYTGDREQLLLEARHTVELVKAAELEDYFQDDCVAALKSRTAGVDHVAPETAVLYPILFEQRIELLLTLPDSIRRFEIPVTKADFSNRVRQFRKLLEKRTTRQYLPHAQGLFDLLLRPALADLRAQGITTLVIVPDDILRTIPLGALHDGDRFLIESYSVAVTPGLTLTDPQPFERRNIRVLLNGLTKGAQGFDPLPYVAEELEGVASGYRSSVLKDEAFQVEALQSALSQTDFGVVHIASHAQFGHQAGETFLLAYDQKINVDRLERLLGVTKFREQPVELLTLSACQTAAGDERAALGLAGVAVKAGARSALASLWFVNDQATARLVTGFYERLKDARFSKADALRDAQLRMLGDRRYKHPGYWSSFLLIGNWL